MIVSFDFDGVLTEKPVQEYAKKLVPEHTVMVHTKRPPLLCKEVFKVTHKLGIDPVNVIFCGNKPKENMLEYSNPVFHLDDDVTLAYDNLVVYDKNFVAKCNYKINEAK